MNHIKKYWVFYTTWNTERYISAHQGETGKPFYLTFVASLWKSFIQFVNVLASCVKAWYICWTIFKLFKTSGSLAPTSSHFRLCRIITIIHSLLLHPSFLSRPHITSTFYLSSICGLSRSSKMSIIVCSQLDDNDDNDDVAWLVTGKCDKSLYKPCMTGLRVLIASRSWPTALLYSSSL